MKLLEAAVRTQTRLDEWAGKRYGAENARLAEFTTALGITTVGLLGLAVLHRTGISVNSAAIEAPIEIVGGSAIVPTTILATNLHRARNKGEEVSRSDLDIAA